MAEHEIEINIPPRSVLYKDVTFIIRSNDSKLGELRISKGSIDWRPGNKRKVLRMEWEQFDKLMRSAD